MRPTLRAMTNFKINIVSDTVCPWCYIGKKRLERAITTYKSTHPNATFAITWAPFYLDPSAPKEGIEKAERLAAKFGAARVAQMQNRLATIGKAEGINFATGGRTGNTRDSHRLIQLGKSKSEAVQTRVVEELFKGYFEEEQDITSKAFLRTAGVQAGLDEAEVTKWLDSDAGGSNVDKEVKSASRFVNGVPNFTIQERFHVDGAQDPEEFLKIFDAVARQED